MVCAFLNMSKAVLISVFRYSALMLAAVTQSCQFRILQLRFC